MTNDPEPPNRPDACDLTIDHGERFVSVAYAAGVIGDPGETADAIRAGELAVVDLAGKTYVERSELARFLRWRSLAGGEPAGR